MLRLLLFGSQVRTLCHNPNGGIPATFLSSQQSASDAKAVKDELRKASGDTTSGTPNVEDLLLFC